MRALALMLSLIAGPAFAVDCATRQFDGNRYSICEAHLPEDRIALFLDDDQGQRIGQFDRLQEVLAQRGQVLQFAMNAGMYHEDRSPVGHYVENGKEYMRVIPNAGPGNFGLLPNGIFCVMDTAAHVIETRDFLETRPDCRFASQSGPMLVVDGALHPRFLPESTSRYIRNGVGTSRDGQRVVFAISDNAVTFHEFGRFFKDALGLPDALFFDGNVSRLYAPALNRSDVGRMMGPIVGVVADRSASDGS